VKVAIASGLARRFVVGDPTINYLDALAGATVARTSTAEHHAQSGDVILNKPTVNTLGEVLTIKEWPFQSTSTSFSSSASSSTMPSHSLAAASTGIQASISSTGNGRRVR